MSRLRRGLLAPLVLLACLPELEGQPGLVEHPQIVAVRAVPAEVRPGEAVEYSALAIGPEGPVEVPIEWSYCLQPSAVADRGLVSKACAEGRALQVIGPRSTVPADACRRFGPTPPPAESADDRLRPMDPDTSGGYHLPVRAQLELDAPASFGLQRIRCDLPGATRAVFEAFDAAYQNNRNPGLFALSELEPVAAFAGQTVRITLTIAPDAAEAYPIYLAEQNRLQHVVEGLELSWYLSAGALENDIAGPTAVQAGEVIELSWRLPESGARAWLWAKLSDDRGGVSWLSLALPREGLAMGQAPRQ